MKRHAQPFADFILKDPPACYAQSPWSQRRRALAQHIAKRGPGGLPVNLRYTIKTNTNEPDSRDLRRFITEGYATMSFKSSRPVMRPRPCTRPVGKQHKTVKLTNKGWLLINA